MATLLIEDRLCPVTVLGLSDTGFYAEGACLQGISGEFHAEIDLPGIVEPSWSPKAPSQGGADRNALLRARARVLDIELGSSPHQVVVAVHARFDGMTDECQKALRGWLEQRRRLGAPPGRSSAGPPPRNPEADRPALA
jgi:hypothetical protein